MSATDLHMKIDINDGKIGTVSRIAELVAIFGMVLLCGVRTHIHVPGSGKNSNDWLCLRCFYPLVKDRGNLGNILFQQGFGAHKQQAGDFATSGLTHLNYRI